MALPTVIYPLTLAALLDHVLATQSSPAATTLIICSSRETFLQDLARSLQLQGVQEGENLQQLITPTLRNLFIARHVKLAFCPSVQALLAYFAVLEGAGEPAPKQDGAGDDRMKEQVVVVNPLSLHALTPSFSAQGLSRTFAAAVETATRIKAQLVAVECQKMQSETNLCGEDDADMTNEEQTPNETEDPWEQEVSILNVSAKRFGSGTADGAWAGRTVKVKRIAGRWFRFHKMDDLHEREQPG